MDRDFIRFLHVIKKEAESVKCPDCNKNFRLSSVAELDKENFVVDLYCKVCDGKAVLHMQV